MDSKILFPFKVYKLADYKPEQLPMETAWRTVRVRSGVVITKAQNPIRADGTDLVSIPDDQNDIPDYSPDIDVTLPNIAECYWFWVQITLRDNQTPLITVRNGATSTTPTEWSRTARPLAQVHVEPQSQTLRVTQVVHSDIFEFRL
jgi:hypothetical protein